MRTTYIVTYDIANDKRLKRIFKICRNYGDHLQFSVFQCDLNSSELSRLEADINSTINTKEDQVLFISLGPAEGRGDRVIRALGQPYVKMDSPCYIV